LDRIVVEVDENRYAYADHELYRRVWGIDWPVVFSARFDERRPAKEQFGFRSREC
jgi:hypothetical protein